MTAEHPARRAARVGIQLAYLFAARPSPKLRRYLSGAAWPAHDLPATDRGNDAWRLPRGNEEGTK